MQTRTTTTRVPFAKLTRDLDVKLKIVTDRCKGCDFCVQFCPTKILELDEAYFNKKGYHIPKLKEGSGLQDCSDCKFCQIICPEFAIFVETQGDKEAS